MLESGKYHPPLGWRGEGVGSEFVRLMGRKSLDKRRRLHYDGEEAMNLAGRSGAENPGGLPKRPEP